MKQRLKIFTYNIGLSDFNSDEFVPYNSETTIGTSIRGSDSNSVAKISIRDCATILKPIILENYNDFDIFIKIDCEGSEFAVLRTLNESGLLTCVRGIMMEWNKWWSADMTDDDIINWLKSSGFYIFNLTSYMNPHAGNIYAINTNVCMSM